MKNIRFIVLVLALGTLVLSACGAEAAPATPAVSGGKVEAMPVAFVGNVDSIAGNQWVISGTTVTVDAAVVRDGPFSVGDQVKVEGVVNANGSFTVSRVELPAPQDVAGLPRFGDDNGNDANVNDDKGNDANINDDNGNDANINDDHGNDANINDDHSNDANINDDHGGAANTNDDNSSNVSPSNNNTSDNHGGSNNKDNGGKRAVVAARGVVVATMAAGITKHAGCLLAKTEIVWRVGSPPDDPLIMDNRMLYEKTAHPHYSFSSVLFRHGANPVCHTGHAR